jgi:TatD DNase family protein
MLIDSHCHLDRLDLGPYDGDTGAAILAARAAGVATMLCIGVDLPSLQPVIELAESDPAIFATVGVHPLYRDNPLPDLADLIKWAGHPKVVALGETGLDYFYPDADQVWQQQSFETHIEAAHQTGLPLVIHTRQAKQDTLAILRDGGRGNIRGVLHCFTEDLDMALQAVELGFLISISGIVTFANAGELRDVVSALPLDALLIETDSPWLAPVPYRGRSNEPRYLPAVAEAVAKLKGIDVAELATITSANFFRLFNKAQAARPQGLALHS